MFRDLLALFMQPSRFPAQPEAYIGNKIGHFAFVGFGGCVLLSWIILNVTGQWPDQRFIFAAVLGLFAFAWEWALQGWKGWDSFEDSLVVGIGASAFLTIDMRHVIGEVMACYVMMCIVVGPGALKRLRERENER